MSDHYELLGIRRDASASEIGKAYQRKVKSLMRLPDAQRAVQEKILKHAHDVLVDPEKRTDYDSRLQPATPMLGSTASAGPLIVGVVVVALTAAGIGYFLLERSKERAQMRMDERRAAEMRAKEKAAPAPQPPAKR